MANLTDEQFLAVGTGQGRGRRLAPPASHVGFASEADGNGSTLWAITGLTQCSNRRLPGEPQFHCNRRRDRLAE